MLSAAIARLGQVEWVGPAVFAIALVYLLRGRDRLGITLLTGFVLAAVATAASKVAFMGWGIGSATIDFTGISGHAMCSAAIYPVIGASLKWRDDDRARASIALGCAVALSIGLSRIASRAHSPSEVLAGLLLGAAVASVTMRRGGPPPLVLQPLVVGALMLVIATWPSGSEPTPLAHSVLARIALTLSGRTTVYTRDDLHRPQPQAARDASDLASAAHTQANADEQEAWKTPDWEPPRRSRLLRVVGRTQSGRVARAGHRSVRRTEKKTESSTNMHPPSHPASGA